MDLKYIYLFIYVKFLHPKLHTNFGFPLSLFLLRRSSSSVKIYKEVPFSISNGLRASNWHKTKLSFLFDCTRRRRRTRRKKKKNKSILKGSTTPYGRFCCFEHKLKNLLHAYRRRRHHHRRILQQLLIKNRFKINEKCFQLSWGYFEMKEKMGSMEMKDKVAGDD